MQSELEANSEEVVFCGCFVEINNIYRQIIGARRIVFGGDFKIVKPLTTGWLGV
ncbi:hypothetical protein ABMA57_05585 [Saccharospirillum sp. HFRX-1]|uniref:hypothetical protein n=1 Tax=unclassified Saccharospirillum TaxID=2633430 RepID=UPI003719FEF3